MVPRSRMAPWPRLYRLDSVLATSREPVNLGSHRMRGALGFLYRPGPLRGLPPAALALQREHYSGLKMCQQSRSEHVSDRFVRVKEQKPGYLVLVCPFRESKLGSKIFRRFHVSAGQKPKNLFQLARAVVSTPPRAYVLACVSRARVASCLYRAQSRP